MRTRDVLLPARLFLRAIHVCTSMEVKATIWRIKSNRLCVPVRSDGDVARITRGGLIMQQGLYYVSYAIGIEVV